MIKRIKLLNYGVDKITQAKLKSDIRKLDNKDTVILTIKYDYNANRFYIVY